MLDWVLHGVIGVVLVLGVMILIHEWGHFAMARLFKVRVDVFSIGFGPRLFGWKRGHTDYRVSALPLGGYVRMAGQDPTDIDSADRDWVRMRPGQQKETERAGEATYKTAEFRGVEQPLRVGTGAPDELMSKPRWQRALISFAGPAVNLLFPVLLLAGFFMVAGVPYAAYYDKPVQIVALTPNSMGAQNPLEVGDHVLSVNGVPTPDWEQAFKALKQVSTPGKLRVVVENNGVQRTVEVPVKEPATADLSFGYPPLPPVIDQVQGDTPAARAGLREDDKIVGVNGQKIQYWGQFVDYVRGSNGKPVSLDVMRKGQVVHTTVTPQLGLNEDNESVYQIGIMRREQTSYRRVGLSESVNVAASFTWDTVQRTVEVVGKLFTGRVSISQLQGPVGISHEAKRAVDRGPLAVISLMVLISINLGILNLLPIPILDGGNILLLAIEGGLRRDLSMTFKERYVQVGLVFLLVLFAIVMYHDVLRRLPIHS
jgi:regulator of sigma E protease